jgi:hypothetical protein
MNLIFLADDVVAGSIIGLFILIIQTTVFLLLPIFTYRIMRRQTANHDQLVKIGDLLEALGTTEKPERKSL